MKPDVRDVRMPPGDDDPKEKIKGDILAKFREINADEGHTLPRNWLERDYPWSLNPKEKAVLNEAVDGLVEEGLVEWAGSTLRLTKKGVDAIY